MQPIESVRARSATVVIEGDLAVLSFLGEIDGHPNVAVSMKVHVLENLQSRIARALQVRSKDDQKN